MTENYELPVLFTEEERKAYASWGIKKEKVLIPFAIATILIYVVTAAFVVMKVWGVRDSDHVLFQMLVLGDWIPELTGTLAILMTILLLGPLNYILDKLCCPSGLRKRTTVPADSSPSPSPSSDSSDSLLCRSEPCESSRSFLPVLRSAS